jgi:hypothetical protein
MKEKVTITREEYERLLSRNHMLDCLEDSGVDNWSGYGDAQEMFDSEEED